VCQRSISGKLALRLSAFSPWTGATWTLRNSPTSGPNLALRRQPNGPSTRRGASVPRSNIDIGLKRRPKLFTEAASQVSSAPHGKADDSSSNGKDNCRPSATAHHDGQEGRVVGPNPGLRAGNKNRPGGIGREALSAAALYLDMAPKEPKAGCAVPSGKHRLPL
jgi:hypothetical protein